jgi:LemA protein
MVGFVALAFLMLVAVAYAIVIYNNLVRVRNEVKLAWANIDVLLVQRHDEIPKLIEVCKGYMRHESETLERVAHARAQVDAARGVRNMASMGQAEGALRSGLSGLYAVAERYPDLKANTLFQNLHARISALETAIADRREVYNDAVTAQNVRIETFPDAMVASWFGFSASRLLKFSADQTSDVDVKLAFGR